MVFWLVILFLEARFCFAYLLVVLKQLYMKLGQAQGLLTTAEFRTNDALEHCDGPGAHNTFLGNQQHREILAQVLKHPKIKPALFSPEKKMSSSQGKRIIKQN